jgi:hypothetical protein
MCGCCSDVQLVQLACTHAVRQVTSTHTAAVHLSSSVLFALLVPTDRSELTNGWSVLSTGCVQANVEGYARALSALGVGEAHDTVVHWQQPSRLATEWQAE